MNQTISKKYHIVNLCLLVCAITCLICYDIYGGLWLKGVTSLWFVMLGAVNLTFGWRMGIKKEPFLYLIEAGLIFGMCADVLLGVEFIFGILSFAVGHILYLVAFFMLEKPRKRDLYLMVPLSAACIFIVTGTPFIRIEDPMLKKMLIGYAVVIACMLGKAVSNFAEDQSHYRRLIMIGSAMFLFSDLILAIDMFGTSSRWTWVFCSYTYWPAQNIQAYALFHYIQDKHARRDSI